MRGSRLLTVRAAVGALLVTLALLGVSQAHARADRPPTTRYAVAAEDLEPGATLTPAVVELVAADLPAELAARAFTSPGALDGAVTLAPFAAGELLLLSQVLPAGTAPAAGVDLSFSVATDRALGGRLHPGETVDLVASFPTRGARRVARGALVVRAGDGGDALLADGRHLVLTVRLAEPADLLDVVDAVDEGQVTVTRPAPGPPS